MKSPHEIFELLTGTILFKGLTEEQLQDLAQKTTYHEYPTGHILIEEGIISQRIIYVVDGLVKMYKLTPSGKELFLSIEKTHNFLGVMNLDEHPGSATVETLVPTKVLVFYKKDLVDILHKYPFLWERMYQIILAKFNELRLFHGIRLGNDLYKRTWLMLDFLSQLTTDRSIPLSQEDVAHIVDATRPRVTEILHKLRNEGKISLTHRKIIIHA